MKEDPSEHESVLILPIKAVRIHQFGGLEVIMYEEVSRPAPEKEQVLVGV